MEGTLIVKVFASYFINTVISLAGYGLITENFKFQSYMLLFLGLTMLVIGLREFQKYKKVTAG